MKKIIKLTESDLTRIVKRVIKEQNDKPMGYGSNKTGWSDDEVYQFMNQVLDETGRPHEDFSEMDQDKQIRIISKYMSLTSDEDVVKSLNKWALNKINSIDLEESKRIIKRVIKENEDEEDDNFLDRVKLDFGRPKDFTAIISDISDLISYSEDVNDFKMKLEEFTEDNQEDLDNLTDNERNRLDGFINSVITRYNFNS